MTNVIAKKIITAALTVATLTGGMAATQADAALCSSHEVTGAGSSAGAVAKFRKRRAERRAINDWEDTVTHLYGAQYADYDNALRSNITFGVTKRGNTSASVFGIVTVCR